MLLLFHYDFLSHNHRRLIIPSPGALLSRFRFRRASPDLDTRPRRRYIASSGDYGYFCGLCPSKIHGCRLFVAYSLMRPDKVIFIDVITNCPVYLSRLPVFFVIDFFPLQAPEKPPGYGVVGCPAFAVHADFDPVVFNSSTLRASQNGSDNLWCTRLIGISLSYGL